MSADTQPTLPLPEEWGEPDAAPRRRRPWSWLVGVLVVLALAAAAWFAGEWIARDLVTKAVKEQVIDGLDLAADEQIDVDIPGSVLWQLAVGTLADVRISSDDITVGGVSGAVVVDLHELGLRGEPRMQDGTATVTLTETQLRALLATVDGFPADTVGIADPDITASVELKLFGLTLPLGLALTPAAADGELVLTPASLTLGDTDITADALRQRFGGLVDPVLQGYRVCIAEYLPAGVPLTGVRIAQGRLVADFDVQGSVLTAGEDQPTGTCA